MKQSACVSLYPVCFLHFHTVLGPEENTAEVKGEWCSRVTRREIKDEYHLRKYIVRWQTEYHLTMYKIKTDKWERLM